MKNTMLKSLPEISVVMPLYNKAAYVRRAVKSVLGQSFTNFELIIVNDGSTDGSLKKVLTFKDTRVKIINQKNLGVSAARNAGIKAARAKIVTFLDADDEYLKFFLARIYALYKKYPQAAMYATGYKAALGGGKIRNYKTQGVFEGKTGIITNLFKYLLIEEKLFITSCVGVKKSVLTKKFLFEKGLQTCEDFLFYMKIYLKYPIAYDKSVQMIYHAGVPCSLRASERFYGSKHKFLPFLEKVRQNNSLSESEKTYLSEYIARVKLVYVSEYILDKKYKQALDCLKSVKTKLFSAQVQAFKKIAGLRLQ
jgi:glycosyltransferase involved in cell wall biosynthesis